jgi:hypothetical protein
VNQPRIEKLEALLDRIRRNRMLRPTRSSASEPIALDALPVTTAASPAAASARPAAAPAPMIAPTPTAVPVSPPAVVQPSLSAAPAAAASRTSAQPAPTPPMPPATFAATPEARVDAAAPAPEAAPPAPTTPSWRPEPGSAVQARPTTVPPMELSEDDLIDVTTLPPPPDEVPVVSAGAQESALDEEEQPPASSRRSKVSESLEEVIASAAPAESDRDIPVKTPPPESGPQEALPATGLDAPALPDVESLEADLSGPPSLGPTAEQLGETIELEAPRGPELEIDVAVTQPEPEVLAPAEELEVTLPRSSLQSGLYDVPVTAPPGVAAPEAHVAITVPAATSSDEGPVRTARPALGATDVAEVKLGTAAAPKSFIELLDASLGL